MPVEHVETPMPIRTLVQSESFYQSLDPGIRFAVRVLHAHGVDTHQSCQGGTGHCYDRPTVDFENGHPNNGTGFAAMAHLVSYGLPVDTVAYLWHVHQGIPHENFWRITFHASMEDRADEQPMFAWGYQHHA